MVDVAAMAGGVAKEDDVLLHRNAVWQALYDTGTGCFLHSNASTFLDALHTSFSPHAHGNEVAYADEEALAAVAAKKHHY